MSRISLSREKSGSVAKHSQLSCSGGSAVSCTRVLDLARSPLTGTILCHPEAWSVIEPRTGSKCSPIAPPRPYRSAAVYHTKHVLPPTLPRQHQLPRCGTSSHHCVEAAAAVVLTRNAGRPCALLSRLLHLMRPQLQSARLCLAHRRNGHPSSHRRGPRAPVSACRRLDYCCVAQPYRRRRSQPKINLRHAKRRGVGGVRVYS
eukprot:COSAG01_NODE_1070_length_11869_cov_21.371368_9_plen_203_part_00